MPDCRLSIFDPKAKNAFDFGSFSFVDEFIDVIDRDYPEFWFFLPRYVDLTEDQIWKYSINFLNRYLTKSKTFTPKSNTIIFNLITLFTN